MRTWIGNRLCTLEAWEKASGATKEPLGPKGIRERVLQGPIRVKILGVTHIRLTEAFRAVIHCSASWLKGMPSLRRVWLNSTFSAQVCNCRLFDLVAVPYLQTLTAVAAHRKPQQITTNATNVPFT